MNVLFTSSWFPGKSHRTLGNFVQYHAKAVGRYENVFVLYVTPLEAIKDDFQIEHSIENGVDITRVYFKKKFGKYSYIKAFKFGLDELIKQRNITFDFLQHNIMLPHGWQALYLNRKLKLPYLISENWSGYQPERNEPISFFQKIMLKRLIRKACVICPVTEHLQKAIQRFGDAKAYEIVANVVDTDLFCPDDSIQKEYDFIHISTLDDRIKNVSGIIRTFSEFLKIYPKATLLIIGDGDRTPFIHQIEELAIKKSVTIIGEQKRTEIAKWLKKSKVYIQFSNYENLPLVIIEAMATGLAVISTKAGGISEHINNSNGILLDKKDEKGLLKAMQFYFENYSSIDSNRIREYAFTHFSEEKIGQKFVELYTSCKSK